MADLKLLELRQTRGVRADGRPDCVEFGRQGRHRAAIRRKVSIFSGQQEAALAGFGVLRQREGGYKAIVECECGADGVVAVLLRFDQP